jgi:hypothetical protein
MSLRVAVALLTIAGLALWTAGLLVEKAGSHSPQGNSLVAQHSNPNPISQEVER